MKSVIHWFAGALIVMSISACASGNGGALSTPAASNAGATACNESSIADAYKNSIYQPTIAAGDVGQCRRECDDGDGYACRLLAAAYHYGYGVDRDPVTVAAAQRKGCDAGNAATCGFLGARYADGEGVEKDASKASDYFQKKADILRAECESGDSSSCRALASDYKYGRGVDKDEAKADELYAMSVKIDGEACGNDDALACGSYAYALEKGRGVAKDGKEAAGIYARSDELNQNACDGGDYNACESLAMKFQTGSRLEKNAAKAIDLFRKACEGGNIDGCNGAAWLLATAEDEHVRNGDEALRLAVAIVAAKPEYPHYLDTLGAAYARVGDFGNAERIQRKAIEHSDRSWKIIKYAKRLQLYEGGKTYQEGEKENND